MHTHLGTHKDVNKQFEEDKLSFQKDQEVTKKRKKYVFKQQGPVLKQAKFSFTSSEIDKEMQDTFDEAVVDFAADNKVSFNVLGSESFKKMIRVVNRKIKTRHRTSYSKMTGRRANQIKQKICDSILAMRAQMQSVTFTTDLWTSDTGDSYCSLTVQFIDDDWNLHRFTPFCKHFKGKHTGKRIALSLDTMIEDLKLSLDKLNRYCVNDNASNQKLAIKLSKYLEVYFCDLHTLQLAIRDAFKDVLGMKLLLKRCKKLAKFSHKSTVAMMAIKNKCKEKGIKFKKPKNPQATRWNSQFENMSSILYLKGAIKELTDEDDGWHKLRLKDDDWDMLEGAVNVLGVLKSATKVLEAETSPTMNLVLERIYTIREHLKDFSTKPGVKRDSAIFAKALMKHVDQRFLNSGTNIFERCVGNYLDPRWKGYHVNVLGKLEDKNCLSLPDPLPLPVRLRQ